MASFSLSIIIFAGVVILAQIKPPMLPLQERSCLLCMEQDSICPLFTGPFPHHQIKMAQTPQYPGTATLTCRQTD